MKIRVSDSDGVYKGGLFKTASFNAMTCRTWRGPPHADYDEVLIDIAGKDSPCYDSSWYRLQIAHVPDVSGPPDGSDDFDANSRAVHITLAEAAAWLDRHGFSRPADLIVLLGEKAPRQLPTATRTATPMSDGTKEVWDALLGKVLTGKQLAVLLNSNEDAIRKRVDRLNGDGHTVQNRRGAGYFRPDALPSDAPWPASGQPESG